MEKSKKILLYILLPIMTIFLVGGIALSFVLAYNNLVPNQVKVFDDGDSIYFNCDMNDNFEAYRFYFEGKDRTFFIDSSENSITVDDALAKGAKLGEKYKISVLYLKNGQGVDSERSAKIEWTCYNYLKKPQLSHYSDEEGEYLVWNEISNADYYEVYFGDEMIQTEDASIDLQKIRGGEKEFTCIAKSNNVYLKDSKASDIMSITLTHKFKQFSDAQFNLDTKTLVLKGEEDIKLVSVSFDAGQKFDVIPTSTYDKTTNLYTLTINLSDVFEQTSYIGVCPATIDQYNIYEGTTKFIQL